MRTPPALVLTLALSSVVTGCGRHNGAVVMGIGIATIVAAPIVGSAASEPPPDRSDGAPDGLHLDLGPAVVGGTLAITGVLIVVAGLVGWVRANADREPRRAPPVAPIAEATSPHARTLERAVIRARAGNCAAALRLADELFDLDEFFYDANVRRDPALAACLAARD